MNWWEQAACRGRPTAWWYPERGDVFVGEVARAVCARCPVRRECLDDALESEAGHGYQFGIRGGKSAVARARMLRRRAVCP